MLLEEPCTHNPQALSEVKALTPNQKKKRRQKLAKLGARQKAGGSGNESLASDNTFEAAASEASTTAFAGFASSCSSKKISTKRHAVAGLAAELMSGVSADLDPPSLASPSESACIEQVRKDPLSHQPAQTFVDTAHPTVSETVASSHFESFTATHVQSPSAATSAQLVQVSIANPAHLTKTCIAAACQATPLSSQPPDLVCRRDMSSAALAVQASLASSSSPDLTPSAAASPPTTAAREPQPAAKRQKRVFLHGNYNRYYGYRLGADLAEDPRVQVLDRRWFHGKRCLDIGCNEGVITLAAVQRFAPLSMLGVDIDADLIKAACRALAKQRTEASSLLQRFTRHDSSVQLQERPAAQRKAAAAAVRAYANVWFTCEDFASSQHSRQSLDTVMCLSVTKWVHLNQGDEGLKRLFAKVKEALVPGGWFILEPQPWRSYKQARRKQDMSAAPFARLDLLQLRPEGFVEYLEQELGFVLARELHVATSSTGFNRPMYLLQRGM